MKPGKDGKMAKYFFDTYALIEIAGNNPNYIKFIEENVVTTRFNLVELIYAVISKSGEDAAKNLFERFKDSEIHVPDEIIFKAMIFRFRNKKKNLSYVDCIGYMFAIENSLKFLTGDEAFRGLKNVEFVK